MAAFANRFWTDVFGYASSLGAAYVVDDGPANPADWKTVKIEVEGLVIKTTVAPEPPYWLRIAANPSGDYVIVAQQSALLVYDSVLDTWVTNGLCFGQRPVGVGWNGSNFVILSQSSPSQYRRIIYGVSEATLAIPFGTTSQGVLQYIPGAVAADDVIRWTDPNRTTTINGRTLYLASVAGGVYLGQWDGAGSMAVLASGDVSLPGDVAEDPRIASVASRYVTGSWGPNATQFVTYAPPWPGLTPAVPPDTGGGGTGLPGGGGIVAPGILTNSALARSIERTLPRLYHETDQIPDAHTQRAARLLWDRTYDLSDQMIAVDAHVGDFGTRLTALETAHAETRRIAESAGVAEGKAVTTAATGTPTGSPAPAPGNVMLPPSSPIPYPGPSPDVPPSPIPGQADLGSLAAGIATAPATGHVTAGQPLTLTLAGQIIGGTVKEWASLTVPAVDLAARSAQVLELSDRIAWHLNLGGIPILTNLYEPVAGGGFSSLPGAIYVTLGGVGFAYSLFEFNSQYVDNTVPLTLAPGGVFPVPGYAWAGTPD